MDHPEFHRNLGPFSLRQISDLLNADLECQDDNLLIHDFNSIDKSKATDITFINDNFSKQIDSILFLKLTKYCNQHYFQLIQY